MWNYSTQDNPTPPPAQQEPARVTAPPVSAAKAMSVYDFANDGVYRSKPDVHTPTPTPQPAKPAAPKPDLTKPEVLLEEMNHLQQKLPNDLLAGLLQDPNYAPETRIDHIRMLCAANREPMLGEAHLQASVPAIRPAMQLLREGREREQAEARTIDHPAHLQQAMAVSQSGSRFAVADMGKTNGTALQQVFDRTPNAPAMQRAEKSTGHALS